MKIAIYGVSSVITNGRLYIGWSVKGLDWRALGAEGGGGWNSSSIHKLSIIPHTMHCPPQALIVKTTLCCPNMTCR
jgi:hypothetical protein